MKSVKLSSSSLYLAICFHDSIAPTKCSSVRQIFQFAACKWQLPTPWYGHWTRVSFAFLPWSWINSRPCAGNPCAGGSSLDDAGPRGGGPETLCELPRDAELLLLLDELLARGSLFASLIALCHDIHSVLLHRSKPSGGKLSSHFSHSWGEYFWNKHMVHDNVFEEYLSKMLTCTCTKKITGGRRGNSREGERKFRQHQHRASVF